ncbi:MFS transporter [Shewanella surugensis]|uniref:MFS transporter n=1 Tax=Shewanella surugensis TaxID=212020 RepID=A0ABT0LD49_9GAMM|nr:MFS transporter [Shewanella surugensis]MCL1125415.1 MFS transporter [Shewanella surugensis]
MNLKLALILLTLVSVVADTMLLPFYPQFFSRVFNVESSEHVGFYIAACCFTVMLAFPLWAKVAKKVNELHLWVYTQIAAAILGIACFYSTDLLMFWILSQTMLIFKASYLLMYPFILRLEEKGNHLNLIGIFSALVHLGAIGGAVVGGLVLQVYEPQDVYLIMASTDILQVFVCLIVIWTRQIPFKAHFVAPEKNEVKKKSWNFVYKIGVVSALFYFSAYTISPFFSSYWKEVSQINNDLFAGIVYSIPGWIALFVLYYNHVNGQSNQHIKVCCLSLIAGSIGLALQGVELSWLVIFGRIVFGIALFQVTVRLEVMLFEMSTPDKYASDFSKVYFMQNMGLIFSSFISGILVLNDQLTLPFYVSSLGFLLTLIVLISLFKSDFYNEKINGAVVSST